MSAGRWTSAVLMTLVTLALVAFGGRLAGGVVLTAYAVLLLALAMTLWPAVQHCFGPVLYCDVVRTTRRGRTFFTRCSYAAVLLLVLVLLFLSWASSNRRHVAEPELLTLQSHEMAQFAHSFFSTFLIAQFALAVLLAPIHAASAITEEKERRTLQFLLATDLRSYEIILSKFISRLGQLLLVVMAGLPILGLMQFLGGIDPELLLGTFAATGLMLLSLCSVSLLLSVYCQTTWDAVFRTYLAGLLLTGVTAILGRDLDDPSYSLGNPVIVWWHLNKAADPNAILLRLLVGYALFHIALAAVCCLWALLALRRVANAQASGSALTAEPAEKNDNWAGDVKQPRRQRPPVSDRALLWKEMYDEPFGWQGRNPFLDSMVLLGAWVGLPLCLILAMFAGEAPVAAEVVNGVIRIFGTSMLIFGFILIGLNAAGRFSREFERQTLDNLLTVPERNGILFAKWWASVLHVRGLWWFLAWIWALGLLSGGLHVLAILLLALAALTYGSFLAALGVWFSLVTRSTLRASIATLLAAFSLTLGTWLVAGMVQSTLEFSWAPLGRMAGAFQDYGAAPPTTLWVLAFPFRDLTEKGLRSAPLRDILAGLIGLAYYAVLTLCFWSSAQTRFRSLLDDSLQAGRAS